MVAGLWVAYPVTGLAQSPEHGPVVLEIPASVRAAALGGAFYTMGDDSDAVFFNPALIGGGGGIGAQLHRFAPDVFLGIVSGALEWSPADVGIGMQALTYGGEGEIVLSAGYARDLMGIRAGVTGKFVSQQLGPANGANGAFDAGLAANLGAMRLGLAVQNLGPGLTLDLSETYCPQQECATFPEMDIRLPVRVTAGASTRTVPVGPLDLGWSAAVWREADGAFIPAAGMEVAYWPVRGRTFIARAGVRRDRSDDAQPFSLGAAFHGDRLAMDYAYQWYNRPGYEYRTHRFGISWR